MSKMSSADTGVKTYSLAEWQEETSKRGGLDCGFRCPQCGHIATPRQFIDLGDDPSMAPQECYGRALLRHGAKNGEVGKWGKAGSSGCCDWAAYGLFKTGGCMQVTWPDGHTSTVFPFAVEIPDTSPTIEES